MAIRWLLRYWALLVATVMLLVAGCVPTPPSPPGPTSSQSARAYVNGADNPAPMSLEQAVEKTRQTLARAGIGVRSASKVYVQPVEPATGGYLTPAEVTGIAAAYRNSATNITWDQLAAMLKDFGFPFKAGTDPPTQLWNLLHELRMQQAASPDDPRLFTATYLMESLYWPNSGKLSPLDLLVFTSHFDRFSTVESEKQTTGPTSSPQALLRPPGIVPIGSTSPAPDPCQTVRSRFGPAGDELTGVVLDVHFDKIMEKLFGKDSVQAKAVEATELVNTLARLLALYTTSTLQIEFMSDNPVHKGVAADQLAAAKAVAGISEEAWKKFTEGRDKEEVVHDSAVLECLAKLGLPAPADLGNIAATIDKWHVEWKRGVGMPQYAEINFDETEFDFPGQLQMKVSAVNEHLGETKPLFLDIVREKKIDHEGGGEELEAYVWVGAELETSERPALQTFVQGAQGGLGLVNALATIMGGWLQEAWQPEAVETLKITYHEPAPTYEITVVGSSSLQWKYKVDSNDPDCEYHFRAEGEHVAEFKTSKPLRARLAKQWDNEFRLQRGVNTSQTGLTLWQTVDVTAKSTPEERQYGNTSGCQGAGNGGPSYSPPPSDCGTARQEGAVLQLFYDKGMLALGAGPEGWWPFSNCRGYGRYYVGPSAADRTPLDVNKLKANEKITVTFSKPINGPLGTGTTGTGTMQWEVTFTPINQEE